MFSQAFVKNSVHRGGVSDTPPGQTRQAPPRADTPQADTPTLGRHPLGRHPLRADTPSGIDTLRTRRWPVQQTVRILLES